jgi:hypothetical protein
MRSFGNLPKLFSITLGIALFLVSLSTAEATYCSGHSVNYNGGQWTCNDANYQVCRPSDGSQPTTCCLPQYPYWYQDNPENSNWCYQNPQIFVTEKKMCTNEPINSGYCNEKTNFEPTDPIYFYWRPLDMTRCLNYEESFYFKQPDGSLSFYNPYQYYDNNCGYDPMHTSAWTIPNPPGYNGIWPQSGTYVAYFTLTDLHTGAKTNFDFTFKIKGLEITDTLTCSSQPHDDYCASNDGHYRVDDSVYIYWRNWYVYYNGCMDINISYYIDGPNGRISYPDDKVTDCGDHQYYWIGKPFVPQGPMNKWKPGTYTIHVTVKDNKLGYTKSFDKQFIVDTPDCSHYNGCESASVYNNCSWDVNQGKCVCKREGPPTEPAYCDGQNIVQKSYRCSNGQWIYDINQIQGCAAGCYNHKELNYKCGQIPTSGMFYIDHQYCYYQYTPGSIFNPWNRICFGCWWNQTNGYPRCKDLDIKSVSVLTSPERGKNLNVMVTYDTYGLSSESRNFRLLLCDKTNCTILDGGTVSSSVLLLGPTPNPPTNDTKKTMYSIVGYYVPTQLLEGNYQLVFRGYVSDKLVDQYNGQYINLLGSLTIDNTQISNTELFAGETFNVTVDYLSDAVQKDVQFSLLFGPSQYVNFTVPITVGSGSFTAEIPTGNGLKKGDYSLTLTAWRTPYSSYYDSKTIGQITIATILSSTPFLPMSGSGEEGKSTSDDISLIVGASIAIASTIGGAVVVYVTRSGNTGSSSSLDTISRSVLNMENELIKLWKSQMFKGKNLPPTNRDLGGTTEYDAWYNDASRYNQDFGTPQPRPPELPKPGMSKDDDYNSRNWEDSQQYEEEAIALDLDKPYPTKEDFPQPNYSEPYTGETEFKFADLELDTSDPVALATSLGWEAYKIFGPGGVLFDEDASIWEKIGWTLWDAGNIVAVAIPVDGPFGELGMLGVKITGRIGKLIEMLRLGKVARWLTRMKHLIKTIRISGKLYKGSKITEFLKIGLIRESGSKTYYFEKLIRKFGDDIPRLRRIMEKMHGNNDFLKLSRLDTLLVGYGDEGIELAEKYGEDAISIMSRGFSPKQIHTLFKTADGTGTVLTKRGYKHIFEEIKPGSLKSGKPNTRFNHLKEHFARDFTEDELLGWIAQALKNGEDIITVNGRKAQIIIDSTGEIFTIIPLSSAV